MNISYKHDLHFAQRRNLGQTTKTNMVLQLAINKGPPFRKCFSDVDVEDGVVSSRETFDAISLPRESLAIKKSALVLRSSELEL